RGSTLLGLGYGQVDRGVRLIPVAGPNPVYADAARTAGGDFEGSVAGVHFRDRAPDAGLGQRGFRRDLGIRYGIRLFVTASNLFVDDREHRPLGRGQIAAPRQDVGRVLHELLGVRAHNRPRGPLDAVVDRAVGSGSADSSPFLVRLRAGCGSEDGFGLELLVHDHSRELGPGTVRIWGQVLGGDGALGGHGQLHSDE